MYSHDTHSRAAVITGGIAPPEPSQAVSYNPLDRHTILDAVNANISSCYTCKSCESVCPVNIGSNGLRLQPARMVRMANMGMLDELIAMPEIWYCFKCNRCSRSCPMTVTPPDLIRFLQREAFHRRIVSPKTLEQYDSLVFKFPAALCNAAIHCLNGKDGASVSKRFDTWLDTPVGSTIGEVRIPKQSSVRDEFRDAISECFGHRTDLNSCLTCGECTSACPLSYRRDVFDPLWIIRMAVMGLKEEILSSPALWLCIECQTCTQVCKQGVKGDLLIRRLKGMAVEEGRVDKAFPERWEHVRQEVYGVFLDRIRSLMTRA